MELPFCKEATLTCSRCQRDFEVSVCLIVNTLDRPDLQEAIRSETLHDYTCPHCHRPGHHVDAPLLLYHPNKEPHLIFSPAEGTTEEEDRWLMVGLVNVLRSCLGRAWQDAWLKETLFVPRAELSALVNSELGTPPYELFEQDIERAEQAEAVFEVTRDESVLEDEIAAWQRILHNPGFKRTPHDFQLNVLARTGQSFFYRYHSQHELDDLETASRLFSEALHHAAANPAFLPILLHSLGDVLTNRYEQTGEIKDLERSIEYYRDAVARASRGEQYLPSYLDDLGTALQDHYKHTGVLESLEQAIVAHRDAIKEASVDPDNLSRYLNHFGNALLARYQHLHDLENLQEAIGAFEQAIDHAPARTPLLAGYLSNLGNALSDRSEYLGTIEDLERAIQLHRDAMRLDPQEAYSRTNLGAALGSYYDRTGRMEALDESIAILTGVVQDTPRSSPDLPDYLVNLGTSLQKRYERRAQLSDLQQAINYYWQALDLVPIQPSEKPDTLTHARSYREPGLHPFREEPGEQEQVLKGTWGKSMPLVLDASARPYYLTNLAGGLLAYYTFSGRVADLHQVVDLLREAIELAPPDSPPTQAWYRRNLGISLLKLHDRSQDASLLDEAIDLFQYGIRQLVPESPLLAQMYNDLGTGLRQRYVTARRLSDLREAIAAFRTAIELWPADAPELPGAYTNLGNALRSSFDASHDLQDLEAAIEAFRSALRLNREDMAANTPVFHSNLGFALRDRYDLLKQQEDMDEARSMFERTCRLGLQVTPEVTLGTARVWGNQEAGLGNWAIATQAYTYAVHALEKLYSVQLLQTEKEGWLSEVSDIYARAAYVMARSGQLREAVTTLEQGRAKRLGESLARDRADLLRVQQEDPQAFQLYQEAADRLRRLEQAEREDQLLTPDGKSRQGHVARAPYEQINRSREDLEQAIVRIRQKEGFTDFLRALTFEDIAKAALLTIPLAYLVTTRWGSMVLLIHRGSNEPELLLREVFTEERLRGLFIKPGKDMLPTGYLPGQISGSQRVLSQALEETLPQLGDHLAGPLGHRLSEVGASGVILVPVGLLSIFPLHAASYQAEGRETSLLEKFDVVYAPSTRILTIARREAHVRRGSALHLLAVGNPLASSAMDETEQGTQSSTYTSSGLIYARAEVEHIVSLLPEKSATALYEHDATVEAVWQNLPQATIAHFACHGYFDPTEPLNSELLLANDTHLTLRDLLNAEPQRLASLQLVVLSACQSAMIDFQRLPDEVVGLPSGFLQAGVPLVIGTLWAVNDRSTALLMTRFYELYLRGDPQIGLPPQQPARALRLAQYWLRNLTHDNLKAYTGSRQHRHLSPREQESTRSNKEHPYADPYYWAAFIYYGVEPEDETI